MMLLASFSDLLGGEMMDGAARDPHIGFDLGAPNIQGNGKKGKK